jgi:disulfide bond formation protein DsbB
VSTDTVTLFLALLAVAAELAVVALVGMAIAARLSPRIAGLRHAVLEQVGPQALWLALLVAGVATGGSLYLSEVAHFVPCRLCWYQRAAMYPLVPVLALAAWRGWLRARWAVLAAAVVGGSISTWHILIENYPSLETSTSCDPNNPCSLIWVRRLGYLTIPTMALSAFALLAMLMLTARRMD